MTSQYKNELKILQVELVKMQKWVQKERQRIVILFEGRDSAGKGGAIRRFARYLNPRAMRVVALPKPTEYEKGQWFFQRYIAELPSAGEIVFFDRSWYNRAIVEPVMGFCTKKEYERFLVQVPLFERFLCDEGMKLLNQGLYQKPSTASKTALTLADRCCKFILYKNIPSLSTS